MEEAGEDSTNLKAMDERPTTATGGPSAEGATFPLAVYAGTVAAFCSSALLVLHERIIVYAQAGSVADSGQRLFMMGGIWLSAAIVGTLIARFLGPQTREDGNVRPWRARGGQVVTGVVMLLFLFGLLPFELPLAARGVKPDDASLLMHLAVGMLIPVSLTLLQWGRSLGQMLLTFGFAILGHLGGALAPRLLLSALDETRLLTVCLTVVGLLHAALPLAGLRWTGWTRPLLAAALVLLLGGIANESFARADRVFERLLPAEELESGERFARTFENEFGLLTVTPEGIVYLNGIYQGAHATSPHPHLDESRSRRAYLVPSIVESPKKLLFIGLGGGAWVQILAHHLEVESIVVLEENPALVSAVRNSGNVASALTNPKVRLVVGPFFESLTDLKGPFDVIIQDRVGFRIPGPSQFNSREHLASLASKLDEGGALYVNANDEPSVQRALADVLPNVLRYQDMIFASSTPFVIRGYHWMDQLENWKIDGRFVLPRETAEQNAHEIVMERSWRTGFAWEKNEPLRERVAGATPLERSTVGPNWTWRLLFRTN